VCDAEGGPEASGLAAELIAMPFEQPLAERSALFVIEADFKIA